MPGKHITALVVRRYLIMREDLEQAAAAAKAGISERTARRIEDGATPAGKAPRAYRTRDDPLEAVWESQVAPLLRESPGLQATTLLRHLQRQHAGQYGEDVLRSLQRRVRQWRLSHGPPREVFFPQRSTPGRQGLSDFTVCNDLGVTLRQRPFAHRLYHFRMAYSGWAYVAVVQGGESYAALAEHLQAALWALGGVPRTHRTDSLSAAYRNMRGRTADDLTAAYTELCRHYGMEATRCNPGKSHENGAIESPHGHLKTRLAQELLLRGDANFGSVADYAAFVAGIVAEMNARRTLAIGDEQPHLLPLPPRRMAACRVLSARVSGFATMRLGHCVYTVPARLIHSWLAAHIYDDRVECFAGSVQVATLERIRERERGHHVYRVNYRHVIDWLVRKPGAFRGLTYRDHLHPSPVLRAAWDALDTALPDRLAVRTYLGILHLAHTRECRPAIEAHLTALLASGQVPDLERLRNELMPEPIAVPVLTLPQPDASSYDALLTTTWAHAPAETIDVKDPHVHRRTAGAAESPAPASDGAPVAGTIHAGQQRGLAS